MAKRFHCRHSSTEGAIYNIEIWDTAFSGASTSFLVAADSFDLKQNHDGDKILNHISPTDCTFEMLMENTTHDAFIDDLVAATEGQFTIKISKGASSPLPHWYGVVVPDACSYAEQSYPYPFSVRASDGIGLLKTIDYKDTSGAYTGKENLLNIIRNCLKKLSYVSIHWGSSDNFIASVVDLWETNIVNTSSTPCFLFYTYLDQSVWQKYDKGEEQYTSCYDVLQNIMVTFSCRITHRQGRFWIENIFYRSESVVIVRTYSRDGGLVSTNNFGTINDINQTSSGALEFGANYDFFPALRLAEHTFKSRARRNFLEFIKDEDITTLTTIYKPIDDNGGTTTLRLRGDINLTISSDVPNPANPFPPLVVIFRLEIKLDTRRILREYDLLPTFQIQYDPMIWSTSGTAALFIGVPLNNPYFQQNVGSTSFSFSQVFDEITPALPEKSENFSIRFTLHEIRDFDGNGYDPNDFTINYQFSNKWLEVYSNGTPALLEDESIYRTENTVLSTNSATIETESVIGTSSDPNVLGAIWVKPSSTYILANSWGIGTDTPDRFIEYFITELLVSGQYSPTKKLQGTLYGQIDPLSRVLWLGQYWLFLGGSWNADRDELTGEWVEIKYDENFNCSPPKKKKVQLVTNTITPTSGGSGQGGASYELIAKPPGTLFFPVSLTTTNVALSAGAITSVPLSEALTDGDVYDGDTIVLMHPITAVADQLIVTATSVAADTAIAVTGTLTTSYPKGSPIIKKPKIGTYTLPPGVLGDLLHNNGTRWQAKNKGSALQLLRTNAAGTDIEWWTLPAGYTDEQAQDAVGNILTDNTEFDWIYDDATPSITAVLKANSILFAKIQQIATARFLGRITSGTGDVEALTAAQMQTALGYLIANQTITLSGDVTGSGSTAITSTIAANAVTTAKINDDAVTYAKIQNVASNNRILGRVSGAGGNVEELTGAQVAAIVGGLTGALTSGRVAVANGATTLTDFAEFLFDGTNLILGTGTAAGYINVIKGALTGTITANYHTASVNGLWYAMDHRNTNNASVNAHSAIALSVGGASAGDPFWQFIITAVTTWSAGVDNSDSDSFKIANSAIPGTAATDFLIIGTDGRMAIGGGTLVALYNLYISGTGGMRVPSGTDLQRTAVAQNSLRNNTQHGGYEARNQNGLWNRLFGTTLGAPEAGLGSGTAGTPTVNAVGNDMAGMITLVAGTAPATNGVLFTYTYGKSFHAQPYPVLFAANENATNVKIYVDSYGNGSFIIKINGTLPTPGTYKWIFNVKD